MAASFPPPVLVDWALQYNVLQQPSPTDQSASIQIVDLRIPLLPPPPQILLWREPTLSQQDVRLFCVDPTAALAPAPAPAQVAAGIEGGAGTAGDMDGGSDGISAGAIAGSAVAAAAGAPPNHRLNLSVSVAQLD